MDKLELLFKHYIPIILVIIAGIINYTVYSNGIEIGAFYTAYSDNILLPYRSHYTILLLDLSSGSKTLIEANGIFNQLSYLSSNCNSCVLYVEASGVDYYVLFISISTIILYIYTVKKYGLNTRLLVMVLLLTALLYTSVLVYNYYNSIPYTEHVYVHSSKPILIDNRTGTAIIDVDLKPDSIITIRADKPVTILYLEIIKIGDRYAVKSTVVKAEHVTSYSDYIGTNTVYNALAITTLSNKTPIPKYTYERITIEYIRTSLPIVNYTPIIILVVSVVFIVLVPRKISSTTKMINQENTV